MPSVIGFDRAKAASTLEGAGFYARVTTEASTQPPGTVIYQDPAAGTSELQTSVVTVTVAVPPDGPT